MSSDIQQNLIETIKTIAGEKLKNVNFTKSYTGIVKSIDLVSKKCSVEIFGTESDCVIPENLSNFIDKDDIVIVQDIANNKFKRIVQGVISSLNNVQFHIYDPVTDTIVSSILQLWDDETGEEINVTFELE